MQDWQNFKPSETPTPEMIKQYRDDQNKAALEMIEKIDEMQAAPVFKTKEEKMQDSVNHPPWYNSGKIEVIEAIEDWKLGMHLGTAVKYIARSGKKNKSKQFEDIEKAIWYCRRYLEIQKEDPCKPNDMNE